MPNQITRDIYVTKDVLKNPIHYVRGTDLIPIVMRFCDFSIPSGATGVDGRYWKEITKEEAEALLKEQEEQGLEQEQEARYGD